MPSTPPEGDGALPRERIRLVPRARIGSDIRESPPAATETLSTAQRDHSGDAATELELVEGDVLDDKYRLTCPLGEGGMGSVWLAHNMALDIDVAVKVLRTDVKGIQGTRVAERLMQEARATAQLGHPAIVKIHDVGQTSDGTPFVVMELLEGEDLATTLERRGRLNAVKAIRSLLPIVHALVAAHDKRVVHRDIKPENIFFARAEDGAIQPKLIDFGVAKLSGTKHNERLTAIGAIMGSPGYMSPEQARGEDVDERADVWAMCVVLYEVVTGRLPFVGKNYHALLRSIIEDAAPAFDTFGIAEPDLWKFVARGMAKNPDGRWATMRELGVALADWLLLRGVKEDVCGASIAATWMRERSITGDGLDTYPPPHLRATDASNEDSSDGTEDSDADRTSAEAAILVDAQRHAPSRRWTTTTRALALVLIALGLGAIWQQGVVQPHLDRLIDRIIASEAASPATPVETPAVQTAEAPAPTATTVHAPDRSPSAVTETVPPADPSAASSASARTVDAAPSSTAAGSAGVADAEHAPKPAAPGASNALPGGTAHKGPPASPKLKKPNF